MKRIGQQLCVLLASICGLASASATELTFLGWHHMEARAFTRITEYLDPEGGERTGNRSVVRTDPSRRTGLYLVFRLDSLPQSPPVSINARLDYLSAEGKNEQTYEFPMIWENHTREIWIGLTSDADGVRNPDPLVAWRLTLRDADGRLVTSNDSFLWDSE